MEQETLRLNRMLHLRNVLKRITGHVIYIVVKICLLVMVAHVFLPLLAN